MEENNVSKVRNAQLSPHKVGATGEHILFLDEVVAFYYRLRQRESIKSKSLNTGMQDALCHAGTNANTYPYFSRANMLLHDFGISSKDLDVGPLPSSSSDISFRKSSHRHPAISIPTHHFAHESKAQIHMPNHNFFVMFSLLRALGE